MATTASQYKKLKEFDENYWAPDSPVVVDKMQLCFDRVYGVNVLQINMRNVTDTIIYGLSISITLNDDRGFNLYKDIDFNYYGIEVAPGKTFGLNEDIIVESQAASFDICVKGADYADGKHFHGKITLDKMSKPVPTSSYGNFEERFAERHHEMYPKAKLICVPERRDGWWRCTCGRIWPYTIEKCTYCKINKEDLMNILPTLRQEERDRIEAEQKAAEEEANRKAAEEARIAAEEEARKKAEEERLAEEERKRQESERLKQEQRKKNLKIGLLGLLGILIICFGLIVLPALKKQNQDIEKNPPDPHQAEQQDDKHGEKDISEITDITKQPLVVLGNDLNVLTTKTIWRLFGTSEKELGDYVLYQISSGKAHAYMDSVIGHDNVETQAISGVLIIPTTEGGINVKLYNISEFTTDEFASKVMELGYENAVVVVASPSMSSGSTAMAGLTVIQLEDSLPEGAVIGAGTARTSINVRAGASLTSKQIGGVAKGHSVEILEVLDNGWLRIVWDNEDGYAYTSNVRGEYYDIELYVYAQ